MPRPVNEHELLEPIGQGAFGQVYRGRNVQTGEIVAVKVINFEQLKEDIEDIRKECRLMRDCSHPNVVKINTSFVVGSKLWIVMELLGGGSVADHIRLRMDDKSIRWSEEQIAVILREVLCGLEYLHSQGKIHRDIKAANILLSTSCSVKIADFGVCGQIGTNSLSRGLQSVVGTPNWMAPEVIEQSSYNAKCDIWSLGITAFEIATGTAPYDKQPTKALLEIPKQAPPQLQGDFSKSFKAFASYCLVKKPEHRPSASAAMQHPFICEIAGSTPTSILQPLVDAWLNFKQDKAPLRHSHGAVPSADADDSATGWDFPETMSSQHSVATENRDTDRSSPAAADPRLRRPVESTSPHHRSCITRRPQQSNRSAQNPPAYSSRNQALPVPKLPLGNMSGTTPTRGNSGELRRLPGTTPRGTPRTTPRCSTPLGTPRGGQVSLSQAAHQSVLKPALAKLARNQRASQVGVVDDVLRLSRIIDECQSTSECFSLLLVQAIMRGLAASPAHASLLPRQDTRTTPATPRTPSSSVSSEKSTLGPRQRHTVGEADTKPPPLAPGELPGPATMLYSSWAHKVSGEDPFTDPVAEQSTSSGR